jgi:hypothetical protein
MDIGRAALLFAFLGAPLIAVVVPIVSFVTLRRRRVSIPAAIIALLVWIGLCAVAIVVSEQATFAYAWMWAHSEQQHIQNPPSAAGLIAMTLAGLLFLGGCGVLLHRFLKSGAVAAAPR